MPEDAMHGALSLARGAWPAACLRAACLAVVTLLVVGGCKTESSKREAEFDTLVKKLPGQYDNLAQAQSDPSGEHAAVALLIRPSNSMTVGKIVLFVRETAYDDPRRVLAQHIWTFALDKKARLVQTIYLFKEPQRWLHAADEPYLLESMLPEDLLPLTGCELIWTKSGEDFLAATKPDSCKASAGAEGLLIEQSAELRGSVLVLNEQLSGPGGSLAGASASSYRFERRAGQAQKQ
jgi:CpeT/CpcT family (DUF1001)